MAQGLGSIMGVARIDTGAILNVGNMIATFVVVMGMVFGFMIVLKYILRFDKTVFLLIKVGEGYRLKKDKGGLIKDSKTQEEKFRLLKTKKITCMIPKSNHELIFGKKTVLIGIVTDGVCVWTKPKLGTGLTTADHNLLNFLTESYSRIDEATKTTQKFWDKYGHQILWLGTIVIFMVIIIMILKRVDSAIDLGKSVAVAVASKNSQVL